MSTRACVCVFKSGEKYSSKTNDKGRRRRCRAGTDWGVMGCNNVELSSARRQIVPRLFLAGDSVTRGGSSLSKLSHHFSSPSINQLRHNT
jgi:hypothetical protein